MPPRTHRSGPLPARHTCRRGGQPSVGESRSRRQEIPSARRGSSRRIRSCRRSPILDRSSPLTCLLYHPRQVPCRGWPVRCLTTRRSDLTCIAGSRGMRGAYGTGFASGLLGCRRGCPADTVISATDTGAAGAPFGAFAHSGSPWESTSGAPFGAVASSVGQAINRAMQRNARSASHRA
jgi:hypothetical protein